MSPHNEEQNPREELLYALWCRILSQAVVSTQSTGLEFFFKPCKERDKSLTTAKQFDTFNLFIYLLVPTIPFTSLSSVSQYKMGHHHHDTYAVYGAPVYPVAPPVVMAQPVGYPPVAYPPVAYPAPAVVPAPYPVAVAPPVVAQPVGYPPVAYPQVAAPAVVAQPGYPPVAYPQVAAYPQAVVAQPNVVIMEQGHHHHHRHHLF
eukprot:TRINITY_DN1718_c0_g1_i1.p1 TRINITY_DN1718_c0_g1~~TRINITY_DN1718_c0_g1_i1.p1  ORF type:complete len:204 (-),score=53.13 TRINITY_DN1718_c0_g1_i1:395-1006(-)